MIKGSIREDITIVNIYEPNIEAPQYIRQILSLLKFKCKENKYNSIFDKTRISAITNHNTSKQRIERVCENISQERTYKSRYQ